MTHPNQFLTPAGAKFPPQVAREVIYPPFKEELQPRRLYPENSSKNDDSCLAMPLPDIIQRRRRFQRRQLSQEQFRDIGQIARSRFQNTKYKYISFGTLDEYADPNFGTLVPPLINFCISEIGIRSFVSRSVTHGRLYIESACRDAVLDIMKYFMEIGPNPALLMEYDVHVLANCITHFLSNLEEPVVPHCMRDAFFSANPNDIVGQLPPVSQATLQKLCPHLRKISKIRGSNQTVGELASVFAPIIFRVTQEDKDYEQAISAMASMIQTIGSS